jgi:hypothetical protein
MLFQLKITKILCGLNSSTTFHVFTSYVIIFVLYAVISCVLVRRYNYVSYSIVLGLTYSMVQDILWKVDTHPACQTIACFLYGARRFITVSIKARHWSLFWASRIQFAPLIPVSLGSLSVLSSHLRLGLPSGLLLSGLPTKTL